MNPLYNPLPQIQNTPTHMPLGLDGQGIKQIADLSVLADLDEQLRGMAQQMQQQLDQKAKINGESGIGSIDEITMLKVQSLVDQRKNALTFLSNLLASADGVARTIIANIKTN
jgi:hypothetical protein